jgi:hypothetical protein
MASKLMTGVLDVCSPGVLCGVRNGVAEAAPALCGVCIDLGGPIGVAGGAAA